MIRQRASLLLLLLLAACSAAAPKDVRIIGHSGMGSDPGRMPNSLQAVISALDLGVHGVELDVQMSSDGVLVCYHEELLESSMSCTGLVNSHTWASLRECGLAQHTGYGIFRLDSLLLQAAAHSALADFTLDCKLFASGDWWSYLESFTDALLQLEQMPALRGRLLVECQVDPFLQLLGNKQSQMPRFLYTKDAEAGIKQALEYGYSGITMHYSKITAKEISRAQEHGLQVSLFGAGNHWSHWRALRKGPDRLQTDAPELFAD